MPIIGTIPGVTWVILDAGKYNCVIVALDVVKEFVLSEVVCTREVISLDVAEIVAPSTVGAVIFVTPETIDADIVPDAVNDDVKIELVCTTGVVILDFAYIVEATTSSNASTDPRVYTGDPN